MERMNLKRINVKKATNCLFYALPKELILNPEFDDVESKAKILYGMLLNRSALSAKNKDFVDKNGDVFIIYTLEQVMNDIRVSNKTAIKFFSQLEKKGLIDRIRRGQGKPSLIYVNEFSTNPEKNKQTGNCGGRKKETSDAKTTPEEVKTTTFQDATTSAEMDTATFQSAPNFHSNHNDLGKLNNRELSIDPAQDKKQRIKQPSEALSQPIDTIDNNANIVEENADRSVGEAITLLTPETVANNLKLSELKKQYSNRHEEIDLLYDVTCAVLTKKIPFVRVNRVNTPINQAFPVFSAIGKEHVEYILSCLEKNGNKYNIKTNTKAYFATSLYNSVRTIDFYYNKSFKKPDSDYDFDCGLESDFFKHLVRKGLRI